MLPRILGGDFPKVASLAAVTIFLQGFLVDLPAVQGLFDFGDEINGNEGLSGCVIL